MSAEDVSPGYVDAERPMAGLLVNGAALFRYQYQGVECRSGRRSEVGFFAVYMVTVRGVKTSDGKQPGKQP